MNDLLKNDTDGGGMPPPTSNNQRTAPEAEKESEGLPSGANKESKGLPGVKIGDTDITPIGNLVSVINKNLKNCAICRDCPLELELNHRIGFASSWKLTCNSCKKRNNSDFYKIKYLKRKRDSAQDRDERRKLGKEASRLQCNLKKRKESAQLKISSPKVKNNVSRTNKHKKTRSLDYEINVRAIVASFYIGTGGMDIGLVGSCLGLKGGKSWEKTFTRHSPKICKAIRKVVNKTIDANLKEEIGLTIKEKLEGKKSKSEIVSLTQKYHDGIKTGIDEIDNLHISVSFDMGLQKKGTGHTYDSNSGHAYFFGVKGGKVI